MLNDLFISNAVAQAAGAPPAQENPIMSFIPIALVMGVFYFLMIRPQKKKMEQEKKYLDTLKKGEEIYTKSGIIGKVHGIAEKIVTLEVEDGGKLKVLKSHVAGSTKDIFKVATTPTAAAVKK